MRRHFLCLFLLIPFSTLTASTVITIGGGGGDSDNAISGDFAELSGFNEASSYEDPADPNPPYFATYSNTEFKLSASAWTTLEAEFNGYHLVGFVENAPEGLTVLFDTTNGRLELEWHAPFVLEPADFSFDCGVRVMEGTRIIETLQRNLSISVYPALPHLNENLLFDGIRLRDAWNPDLWIWIDDPDEPIGRSHFEATSRCLPRMKTMICTRIPERSTFIEEIPKPGPGNRSKN